MMLPMAKSQDSDPVISTKKPKENLELIKGESAGMDDAGKDCRGGGEVAQAEGRLRDFQDGDFVLPLYFDSIFATETRKP